MQLKMTKINWEKEPTMRERIIFGIALFGVFLFFSNSLWSTRLKEIREYKAQIVGLKSQIEAANKLIEATQAQLNKKSTVTQQVNSDEKIRAMLERKILDPIDEIQGVVELLGRKNIAKRLKVKNISVSDMVEKAGYSIVPLALEVEGPYTSLESYLDTLERIDRPISVRELNINSSNDKGNINAKIQAELYIIKR